MNSGTVEIVEDTKLGEVLGSALHFGKGVLMALMGSPVINSGFDDLVDQIVGHGGSPKERPRPAILIGVSGLANRKK
jgi:hypothetical protein